MVRVEDILEVLPEVKADLTLRKKGIDQIMRLQYILEDPLKVQLTLDRKHISNPRQSPGPAAWIRFSEVRQLMDMARNFMVAAVTLNLSGVGEEVTRGNIETVTNALMSLLKTDVITYVEKSLREINSKRAWRGRV